MVSQDAKVVVSALMKLAGGSPSYASELNVDAFLKQVRACQPPPAHGSLAAWQPPCIAASAWM